MDVVPSKKRSLSDPEILSGTIKKVKPTIRRHTTLKVDPATKLERKLLKQVNSTGGVSNVEQIQKFIGVMDKLKHPEDKSLLLTILLKSTTDVVQSFCTFPLTHTEVDIQYKGIAYLRQWIRETMKSSLNESQQQLLLLILKCLNGLPVTVAILQSTKIGKTLVRVSKLKFKESTVYSTKIQTIASEILTAWKKTAEIESSKAKRGVISHIERAKLAAENQEKVLAKQRQVAEEEEEAKKKLQAASVQQQKSVAKKLKLVDQQKVMDIVSAHKKKGMQIINPDENKPHGDLVFKGAKTVALDKLAEQKKKSAAKLSAETQRLNEEEKIIQQAVVNESIQTKPTIDQAGISVANVDKTGKASSNALVPNANQFEPSKSVEEQMDNVQQAIVKPEILGQTPSNNVTKIADPNATPFDSKPQMEESIGKISKQVNDITSEQTSTQNISADAPIKDTNETIQKQKTGKEVLNVKETKKSVSWGDKQLLRTIQKGQHSVYGGWGLKKEREIENCLVEKGIINSFAGNIRAREAALERKDLQNFKQHETEKATVKVPKYKKVKWRSPRRISVSGACEQFIRNLHNQAENGEAVKIQNERNRGLIEVIYIRSAQIPISPAQPTSQPPPFDESNTVTIPSYIPSTHSNSLTQKQSETVNLVQQILNKNASLIQQYPVGNVNGQTIANQQQIRQQNIPPPLSMYQGTQQNNNNIMKPTGYNYPNQQSNFPNNTPVNPSTAMQNSWNGNRSTNVTGVNNSNNIMGSSQMNQRFNLNTNMHAQPSNMMHVNNPNNNGPQMGMQTNRQLQPNAMRVGNVQNFVPQMQNNANINSSRSTQQQSFTTNNAFGNQHMAHTGMKHVQKNRSPYVLATAKNMRDLNSTRVLFETATKWKYK